MGFLQDAPQLPHPLRSDWLLRQLIAERLPSARQAATWPDLEALADHAVAAWQRRPMHRDDHPRHIPWDGWGRRIDAVTLTTAWQEGAAITTRHGILATGHDRSAGPTARLEQFLRVYLYHVASEFYTCPLAMTDGAATVIEASGNDLLAQRALPRFLSRDPETLWLSGQWMTETIGGSDVSRTETAARRDDAGQWRLYGRKWFTSAIIGEAAVALARPSNADGDVALFFVETRDAEGCWDGITIDRLKDKLGTRELPTAEIHLHGVRAWPIAGLDHGVRHIAPVLNVTRTWNAVCSVATMSRCLALMDDYAHRRQVFGKALTAQPLHRMTLARLHAEHAAAFHLAFFVAEQLGRVESGVASDDEAVVLRLATPLAKLWTGKLAVAVASEMVESFGGNGYIEDTCLPQLLRDAHVYPIWEGTTNVLSLDVLRVLSRTGTEALHRIIADCLSHAGDEPISTSIKQTLEAVDRCMAATSDQDALQSRARDIAITLARCLAAALLVRAAWSSDKPDPRLSAASRLFVQAGLSRLRMAQGVSNDDIAALLR